MSTSSAPSPAIETRETRESLGALAPRDPQPLIAKPSALAEPDDWLGPDPERHAWERQPGEEGEDFARFLTYLKLGTVRSVRQAQIDYEGTDAAPAADRKWSQLAARWGWRERASAWDAWTSAQELEALRAKMVNDRLKRADMRERSRTKLAELIEALDPNLVELRPGDLFRAVSLLNDDARADLDRVVEKADDDAKRQSQGVDLLGGAMTLAAMVELAQRAVGSGASKPQERQIDRGSTAPDPIDADFTET